MLAMLKTFAFCLLLPPFAPPHSTPGTLDMRVPVAPAAVAVDGRTQLLYELHLTNFGASALELVMLEVLAGTDGAVLAAFEGSDLQRRAAGVDGSVPDDDRLIVAGGSATVVYIEIVLPDGVPDGDLVHRVNVRDADSAPRTESGGVTRIDATPPPVLGPPLRGGAWAALYHPAWARGHRRVFYVEDGRARLPGRHAIDFFAIDDAGRLADGDRDVIANWFGQGAEVLAVADAVVVAARDDVAESPRISTHTRLPREDGTGNYIALDIGGGRFVYYEHLQPGSVRVEVGQRVARGDVIAAVGFTGHTSGPHLHFHVADTNSPLGAEGMPFVFEDFVILDALGEDIAPLFRDEWSPSWPAERARAGERPPPNAVIRFAAGGAASVQLPTNAMR